MIAAHKEALRYGGRAGILSSASLESAIGRPYSGYHRPIAHKAAALLEALVQNHGFVDGNKRTALLTTLLLIERSRYRLVLDEAERVDDLIVGVAERHVTFNGLVEWFGDRLRRQP